MEDDKMSINELIQDNIRLDAENRGLRREIDYLRILIDRFTLINKKEE